MNLNKSDLVAHMAEEAGITKATAEAALNGALETVAAALAEDGRVSIPGFGAFDVIRRSERMGRNPRTGEPLEIPASNAVRFKAGSRLTERVNP